MIQFEDTLRKSAQRLSSEENKALHVPSNPLAQKRTYWGWVAAPAAAVAGIVLGMSLDLLTMSEPEIRYVQNTDTVEVIRPVRDTVYMTQVVEKVKYIEKDVNARQLTAERDEQADTEEDTTTCTSVLCDGINYAVLALK